MASLLLVLTVVAGLMAVAAWVVAVLSVIRMVRHRAPGVSRWSLATQGLRFYSGKGFTPAAAPHRRRFLIAVGVFFAALLLGMICAALLSGGATQD